MFSAINIQKLDYYTGLSVLEHFRHKNTTSKTSGTREVKDPQSLNNIIYVCSH